MTYSLIFNLDAENEFVAAYKWYEEKQQGLGDKFQQETERQLSLIVANPLAYHLSKGNFRESLIAHFPFIIVFALNNRKKTIYISAIFHTSRNPKKKYRKH